MDKNYILVGMIVALIVGGTTYTVNELLDKDYNLYECYAKDPAVAMLCWKLSAVNSNGYSTRCCWNMSDSRRYKQCSNGWIESVEIEIIGNETTLPDRQDYKIETDFNTKTEAENYISTLKSEVALTYNITQITQKPYSNEITVYWLATITKGEDLVKQELLSTNFPEDTDRISIEDMVSIYAGEWFDNWRPDIIISRNDKLTI